MTIYEAVDILQRFIKAYEYQLDASGSHIESIADEYEATKLLIDKYIKLTEKLAKQDLNIKNMSELIARLGVDIKDKDRLIANLEAQIVCFMEGEESKHGKI